MKILNRVLKFYFSLFLIFIFNFSLFAQEPEWLLNLKKIKPLQDNRIVIRKLYGEPTLVEENLDVFDLKNGKLAITYSYGECSPKDLLGKWKVPNNVVVDIDFEVKEDIDFASLKLNLSNFKNLIPDDLPQMKIYTSEIRGVEYVTLQNKLTDVNVFPSKSQSSLRCKE